MRNYKEMQERVFRRVHEYEDKKTRRNKAMRRFLLTASPVCIAIIIGTGIYVNGLNRVPVLENDVSVVTENSAKLTSKKAETSSEAKFPTVSTAGEVNTSAATETEVTASEAERSNSAQEKNAAETVQSHGADKTEHSSSVSAGKKTNVTQENNTAENVRSHITTKAEHSQSATASTAVQTAKTNAVTAVQPEQAEIPHETEIRQGSMAICDRIFQLTINDKFYLQLTQFNGKSDRFTKDEMIGHGWDFQPDHYWDDTEIYTTKESKYILIARYESGTEIVLWRVNDLIVGEDEYGITGWNPSDYTVKESNYIGTVSDFECIDFPYIDEIRDANGILEPECKLYTADENEDVLIAVHTNGNAVILHKDYNV